jgi:lipoprotein-anchoring transpeptidase ErfK/SrfK
MRSLLLCSALLLAATLPGEAFAGPRKLQRVQPIDPYGEEEVVLEGSPYGGGFIEMLLTGRDPTPYARPYRPLPVDPYTGLPVERREFRRGAPPGAVAALPPSYEFEPENEGIGMAVDPQYQRQVVAYRGSHKPGTIIIDTPSRFLYLVQSGGTAIRYGIGVGRPGFTWAGMKTVSMKREWPDWRPPPEMLKRRPDLPRYMEGGPDNPLGARALYLGSSLYRIHGTNEPHTIGRAVSSGCIRMLNEDVVDLYNRVKVGTPVVVI